jgi:hypothetical protein
MNVDTIQQNARSLADALTLFAEVEQREDEEGKRKASELRRYIIKLTYHIQKGIDEVRDNVY